MISLARLIGWSFELDRVVRAAAIVREELAFRLLAEPDWLELGRVMYGRAQRYRRGSAHNESGLFAFECDAIERFFPPPPAAILVGACGGGREVFGLIARGFRVAAAYDPVAPFIDALRTDPRLHEVAHRLYVCSHQDFDATWSCTDRQPGDAIDAVVVGWGSYTHVLGEKRRIDFLRALRAACPSGPVLLSFFVEIGDEAARAVRFRATLRRLMGSDERSVESGDGLHRAAGGVHYFTRPGFEHEADQAGYRVEYWQEHDFGAAHALLFPRPAEQR